MKNRELIDYCNNNTDRNACFDCPYNNKECDEFIKVMGYSPSSYTDNDKEFLSRGVGENE